MLINNEYPEIFIDIDNGEALYCECGKLVMVCVSKGVYKANIICKDCDSENRHDPDDKVISERNFNR